MSNLRYKKTKQQGPMRGKGFYVALSACLVASGVATWMTYDSISSLTDSPEPPAESAASQPSLTVGSSSKETQPVDNPVSGVPAPSSKEESKASSEKASSNVQETNRPITPSSAAPSSEPASSIAPVTPSTFVMPVPGKVIKPYGSSLYSMTFGDWRAHNGVDLSAAKGSTVQAVGDGTVTDTYEDDMLGYVVVITHGDLEVRYCGLGNNPSVKKGETVKGGQVIGAINVVPSEIVEESHLHLEVRRGGELTEPLAALGKEDKLPSEKE